MVAPDEEIYVRQVYRLLVTLEATRAGIEPSYVLQISGEERKVRDLYWARANGCRQLALYAAHTLFGIPIKPLGQIAGISPQGISRICKIIEDGRDEPEFDAWLAKFEAVVNG